MLGRSSTENEKDASHYVEDTVSTPGAEVPAQPPSPLDAGHRLAVAVIALALSWAGLVVLVVSAIDTGTWDEAGVWVPSVPAVAVLGAVTFMSRRGAGLLSVEGGALAWSVAVLAGLFAYAGVRAQAPPTAAYAAAIVVVAGLIVRPALVLAATALAGVGYYLALEHAGADLSWAATLARLAVLAAVGVIGALMMRAVGISARYAEERINTMRRQEEELQRRQQDLERLYEVSRTIGAGSDLAEVLPELVGRVADSVGAKVGLVLLYVPADQALEVVSPIWVAGHALRAEGYLLPLTAPGLAQRVFISSEADYLNELGDDTEDALLRDLDAEHVAAVPLRLEAHTIGVLMVADPESGAFRPADLETLETLGAPTALILEHLTRFEAARETSERMTELAQLKTDFVSVVSHELRTPLTSIIGILATLSRPEFAPDDPDAAQLLSTARRQANRLKRLIEDLLTVSRLDNRSLPMRPESIELQSFVRDVVRSIPNSDGLISLDLSPVLPLISADPEHLRRLLTNLVDNAIKYGQGSSIEAIARPSGDEVWISIVDHGPGIPYELHDHIFERFTQAAPHETRARGGTGLGLSIVRGLAEAMGGRVWYEPTIGGGATFTIALPKEPPPYRAVVGSDGG